jgi:hypothetical protein
MDYKELLQQIKNRINGLIGFEEAPDNAMYYMRKDQIVWLVSQAEKAVISEELLDQQRAINMKIKLKYTKQKQQLQQAKAENEKLQTKLNSIRFYAENPLPGDKLSEKILQIIDDADLTGFEKEKFVKGAMMHMAVSGFGDKIGQCECCEKENEPLQYSFWQHGYICEDCWEMIAESVISGED